MKKRKKKSFLRKKWKKLWGFCCSEFSIIKDFGKSYKDIVANFYKRKIENFFLRLSNLNDPTVFLDEKYKIISDKPLGLVEKEQLRFGHERIATVICDLFKSTKPPFTLGLFGDWGVGKSTIINLIVNNFENTKIRTVLFDVWKYDDDSLRRQLLIKLDEKLNLNNNFKETLNQSLSIPYRLSPKHSLKLAISITLYSLPIFLLFFILWLIFKFNFLGWSSIFQVKQWLVDTFGKVAIYGIVISFISNLFQSLIRPSSTIQKSATDSSEGFEDCFNKKIINRLKKDEKLLIIIDNLDRTTSEKSLTLLSDIKTFLNNDSEESKAFFLIACDQNAVRQQIKKSGFKDPDQYLRKFFNASISIPKYLGEELDDYTIDLLKQTKINKFSRNNNLAWLITYTFRNNPREIKQFINTLTVYYLLAKDMENNGDIYEKGVITNNIDSLAKILIIKLKFHEEYKKLENLVINESLEWDDINKNLSRLFANYESFIVFVKQTEFINIKNLLIFIRFRQSDREKQFPSLSQFFSNAEYGDEILAKKLIQKFDIHNSKSLDVAFKNEIQRIGSSRGSFFANLVFIILDNFKEKIVKFNKFINEVALKFPSALTVRTHINKLKPSLMFDYIFPNLKNEFLKEKLVSIYSSVINSDPVKWQTPLNNDYLVDLIKTICKNADYFIRPEYKIKENLANFWANSATISTLANNDGYDFMTNSLADNYIQRLKIDLEEKNLNLNLFCLNELVIGTDMTIKNGFGSYFQIISTETQVTLSDTVQKEIILNKFFEYTRKYKDKLEFVNESDPRPINDITSQLIPWFNNSVEEKNKFKMIKIFDYLTIPTNSNLDNIKSLINKFWTDVTYEFLQTIKEEDKKHFFENYHDSIINGIKNNTKLIDSWFKILSDGDIESIVIFNLDRNYQVDMLGNRWGKISPRLNQISTVKINILNRFDDFNEDIRKKMLIYCESDDFFLDPGNNKIIFDYLLKTKDGNPAFVNIFGRRRYFTREQKEQLGLVKQKSST